MLSLSIIIPIYNVEAYIRRCLDSVMTQKFFGATVECILIDDCTPDQSMTIVKGVVSEYKGPISFVLLKHEVNRGLSAARNTGILQAKGDYVFFMDSDDYLMPHSLQYFIDKQSLYKDVDMLIGNVKNCKADNVMINNIHDSYLMTDRDIIFQRMLQHKIYLYAWNKMIKRDILMKHHVFFEEGIIYEDQYWSYLLFSKLSSVLLLSQVTYVYEYNPNSIVHTTFTSGNADKAVWSYTVSTNRMLNCPPDPGSFKINLTVDYLLFMANFLMNGVDVLSRFKISEEIAHNFYLVRIRILMRSLRNGRLMLACFFLLLFSPFSYVQKFRLFRHHYYDLESVVNKICHLTDFFHCK